MTDFSSYIANYVKRNNADIDQVKGDLTRIASVFNHSGNSESIFTPEYGQELSYEDFDRMLDNGAGAQLSDEDVQLLYDILNKDGENGVSYDELQVMVGSRGYVKDYMFYSNLKFTDTKDVKSEMSDKYSSIKGSALDDVWTKQALQLVFGENSNELSALEALEKGSETVEVERKDLSEKQINDIVQKIKDSNGALTLSHFEALLTKDSYDLLEAAVNDAKIQDPAVNPPADPNVNDPSDQAEPPKEPEIIEQQPTGDKSIDDMRTTIANMIANDPSITPEDVISQLDPDVHGQEFIDQLRASYNVYENESAIDTQWEIQKLNNPDITRLEVIEIMRNNGTLGKLVKDSTMPLNETTAGGSSATLSDDRVKEYTTRLWELSARNNYDGMSQLLVDGSISDADVVNIIAGMTEGEPGNWLWMLQESGNREKSAEVLKGILPKIGREALAGNEKAIEILCNVLEMDTANSTEGLLNVNHTVLEQMFGSGDEGSVFGEDADSILEIIKDNYGKYNNGASLANHIRNEWLLDNKDFYLNKLTEIGD